ncbi:MAG: hypothetical protein ACKOFP_10785 [Actinomycetota bacterium]
MARSRLMNPARRIGAATAIVALSTLSVGSAQAVEIPSDLEFSYTMNQPLIGQIRDSASTQCYQSIGDPFTMTMQAGMSRELTEAIQKRGNQIVCTISLERYMSNVVITGTAEASAQGQSGKGSFSLTCETGQKRSSFFSIAVSSIGLPEFGDNPYGMEGNGYLSCTWSIAVEDAEKSQLAGTLELQGAYTKDSERVSCEEAGVSVTGGGNPDMTYCVAYDMNIKAYLTGATGAYAGRTGEGTLTQRGYAAVTVPLKLETDSSCPPDAPNCDQLMNQSLVGASTPPPIPMWAVGRSGRHSRRWRPLRDTRAPAGTCAVEAREAATPAAALRRKAPSIRPYRPASPTRAGSPARPRGSPIASTPALKRRRWSMPCAPRCARPSVRHCH